MMGAQRDRQSNRAFKLASDSVRLWFFPLIFCLCEARAEHSCSYLIFYPPLFDSHSPHWASILAILGSQWVPVVGKMDERSGCMPVSPHACFYFSLIVEDSKQGLRFKDEATSWSILCNFFFHPTPILMECRESPSYPYCTPYNTL